MNPIRRFGAVLAGLAAALVAFGAALLAGGVAVLADRALATRRKPATPAA